MITVLDVLRARLGGKLPEGPIPMSLFDDHRLPMLGGCEVCGACIAAYNAAPTRTGYLRCAGFEEEPGCTGELGFRTVAVYDAWQALQDAEAAADDEEFERARRSPCEPDECGHAGIEETP